MTTKSVGMLHDNEQAPYTTPATTALGVTEIGSAYGEDRWRKGTARTARTARTALERAFTQEGPKNG